MLQAGFSQCASEACGFLLSLPGLDERVGRRLVAHLGQCLASPLSVHVPPRPRSYSPPLDLPPTRPPSSASSPCLSTSPCVQDLSRPLDGLLMTVDRPGSSQDEDVWRPWQSPRTPLNKIDYFVMISEKYYIISLEENISVYIALYSITVRKGSIEKSSIYTHNGLEYFFLHITLSLIIG